MNPFEALRDFLALCTIANVTIILFLKTIMVKFKERVAVVLRMIQCNDFQLILTKYIIFTFMFNVVPLIVVSILYWLQP